MFRNALARSLARTTVVSLALAGLTGGAIVAAPAASASATGPATVATAAQRCTEDMPCWDCETMGNRTCGPAAIGDGRHYIAPQHRGTWAAPGGSACTWALLTYGGRVFATGGGNHPQVVTLAKHHRIAVTNGCGRWMPYGR